MNVPPTDSDGVPGPFGQREPSGRGPRPRPRTGNRSPVRCDFCGYPVPNHEVNRSPEGGLTFCTRACEAAFDRGEDRGRWARHERSPTGVSALDDVLPAGVPNSSLILLSGLAGTRHATFQTELVWRTLQRGECAVVTSFTEPPIGVVNHFLQFDWNVLPFLEAERLHVLDCFTGRLDDPDSFSASERRWPAFVRAVADDAVREVEDPANIAELTRKLDASVEALEMAGDGIVTLDSIDELNSFVHGIQVEGFVRNVRGDLCKGQFVPIVTSTTGTNQDAFPHDSAHLFDGIVDLRFDEDSVPNARLKRLGVRKMDGAPIVPRWLAYELTPDGLVAFDPTTEMGSTYADQSARSP